MPRIRKKPNARRRERPPRTESKPPPGRQAEIALARNVAEIQLRIERSERQVAVLKSECANFEAQKEALMKVAEELSTTDVFDMASFQSVLVRELDDEGLGDGAPAEGDEDDDE